MHTIHHSVCTVIPPHILRNVAAHPDAAETCTTARATLDHMHELAACRSETFLDAVPASSVMKRRRNVYDARQAWTLPGRLVMAEHKKRSLDPHVNEAYDGAGATHDFYASVFGRNSIDNRGLRLDSTVHYGVRFVNAFWNGRQLVYGDGDGRLFNHFTSAIDVIAHELTHGVTQYSSGLGYTGETGALNEHLADAFGIMVKQYRLGQTAEESDWIIGAGLFGPLVHGKGIRSMAAPGTAYDDPILGRDPQPSHMRDFVVTAADRGGVHINSGIPNHAFYRAAMELGDEVWPVLGLIWYDAATSGRLAPDAGFGDFAQLTVTTAAELYGPHNRPARVLEESWEAVGIETNARTPARLPVKARVAAGRTAGGCP